MIETERLILRQWTEDDKDIFADLTADAEVMRYFPKILTREESDAFADKSINHIRENGWGLFATELKKTGEFIGFIGLAHATFESDFTPSLEIGWRLHKNYWNEGYATEGAKRVLDFATDMIHEPEIFSFTSVLNLPSMAVMRKIGMTKVGEFDHPKLETTHRLCRHVCYRIES